jgi:hypothetical protein
MKNLTYLKEENYVNFCFSSTVLTVWNNYSSFITCGFISNYFIISNNGSVGYVKL